MNTKFKTFALTSLAHYANDGNSLLYPILITFYITIPNVHLAYLGLMATIFNLISGFASTPVGRYADKTGKYGPMLGYGIFLSGIGTMLYTFPFVFPSYLLIFLILGSVSLGFGQSFYHPIGATILRNTFSSSDSPKYMGYNGSIGSLGRAIMPTTVGLLMAFIGPAIGLAVYSTYSLVSSVVIYLGLKNIKINRRDIKREETADIETANPGGKRRLLPFVYLLTSAVFLRAVFMTGTATFLPVYLEQEFTSKTLTFVIILIAYMLPVFGQPLFGSLTSKKGGKYAVVFTYVFSSIFFGLFLLIGAQLVLTILFFALYAFAAYSQFPVILGYVGQIVPKDRLAESNAMVWGVGQTIGGAMGAGLVSILTLFFSMPDSIAIVFCLGLTSLLALPLLPRNKNVSYKSAATS